MAVPSAKAEPFSFDALHEAVTRLRQKQVFFVGGTPKSGTTWLQLLLNSHPEISCTGEGHFPDRLLPALSRSLKEHNAGIDRKNRSIFEGLDGQALFTNRHALFLAATGMSLMLAGTDKAQAVQIVGDKTPDNVRFLPILAGLFPQSKFVQIVRDGRDCTVSAWFHNLRVDSAALTQQYPTFSAFAEYYADIWMGNISLGAKFARQQPQRNLIIRYEDLVAHSHAVFGQVCSFLGASREPALLEASLKAADFTRLSGGREPGQEDRDSFFRRGVPGDWREHFDQATDTAFRARTHPWLSNFGYL